MPCGTGEEARTTTAGWVGGGAASAHVKPHAFSCRAAPIKGGSAARTRVVNLLDSWVCHVCHQLVISTALSRGICRLMRQERRPHSSRNSARSAACCERGCTACTAHSQGAHLKSKRPVHQRRQLGNVRGHIHGAEFELGDNRNACNTWLKGQGCVAHVSQSISGQQAAKVTASRQHLLHDASRQCPAVATEPSINQLFCNRELLTPAAAATRCPQPASQGGWWGGMDRSCHTQCQPVHHKLAVVGQHAAYALSQVRLPHRSEFLVWSALRMRPLPSTAVSAIRLSPPRPAQRTVPPKPPPAGRAQHNWLIRTLQHTSQRCMWSAGMRCHAATPLFHALQSPNMIAGGGQLRRAHSQISYANGHNLTGSSSYSCPGASQHQTPTAYPGCSRRCPRLGAARPGSRGCRCSAPTPPLSPWVQADKGG